jgi:hypothetical protein
MAIKPDNRAPCHNAGCEISQCICVPFPKAYFLFICKSYPLFIPIFILMVTDIVAGTSECKCLLAAVSLWGVLLLPEAERTRMPQHCLDL